MGKVAAQFPDDIEIATLHAEALMDVSPWDYWEAGGKTPKPQSAAIVPTLERVLAKDPDHAARSTTTSTRWKRPTVRSAPSPTPTGCAAPSRRGPPRAHAEPHLLPRRPLQGFARREHESGGGGRDVPGGAEAPMGVYPLGYYPHNVHFVMVSAQMAGDGTTVIERGREASTGSSPTRSRAKSRWCSR